MRAALAQALFIEPDILLLVIPLKFGLLLANSEILKIVFLSVPPPQY